MVKTVCLAATLLGALLSAGCQTAAAPAGVPSVTKDPQTSHQDAGSTSTETDLEIRFKGLDESDGAGPVRVALWASQDNFMREGRWLRAASVAVHAWSQGVRWEKLPSGRYAISAFHDTTDCGKFRRNALGLPIDPWAISGRRSLLPPNWARASFELVGGDAVVVLDFGRQPRPSDNGVDAAPRGTADDRAGGAP